MYRLSIQPFVCLRWWCLARASGKSPRRGGLSLNRQHCRGLRLHNGGEQSLCCNAVIIFRYVCVAVLVSVRFSSRAGGAVQSQIHATISCKPSSKKNPRQNKDSAADDGINHDTINNMNTINVTNITDINNQSSQLRCHSGRHNISATVGFRLTVERRRVSWFIAWHGLQSATHDFHDCLTCANLCNAQHTRENTYVAQPTPGATLVIG